jgi:hypothetical protein
MWFLLINFPAIQEFFPIGGLGDLAGRDIDSFEPIYSSAEEIVFAPSSPLRLAFASIGAAILIIPVSWIYFITSRTKEVNQSFVQTIIIMPIVVTGISTIVMNSIPLAFSLAGIVAGVQFRRALSDTFDTLFIFVAIGVGIAAGIRALEIAAVLSIFFNYATVLVCIFGDGLESHYLSEKKRKRQIQKRAEESLEDTTPDENQP